MVAHTVSGGTGTVRVTYQVVLSKEEPPVRDSGPGKAAAWGPALGKGPVGFNTLLFCHLEVLVYQGAPLFHFAVNPASYVAGPGSRLPKGWDILSQLVFRS